MQILPRIIEEGPNVKIIAAISWELFLLQSKNYRKTIADDLDWHDSMVITNTAIKLMGNWIANPIVEKYSLSPDFDNMWRTGGSVDEIINESKIDKESLWDGIKYFVDDRDIRLKYLENIYNYVSK